MTTSFMALYIIREEVYKFYSQITDFQVRK